MVTLHSSERPCGYGLDARGYDPIFEYSRSDTLPTLCSFALIATDKKHKMVTLRQRLHDLAQADEVENDNITPSPTHPLTKGFASR